MLLFFLPLIFAYTALALIVEQADRPVPTWGVSPEQGLLFLVLFSLLLGETNRSFSKEGKISRTHNPFPIQRIIVCLLWSNLVYWEQLDLQLSAYFSTFLLWLSWIPSVMLPGAPALTTATLILFFWMSDSLSGHAIPSWDETGCRIKLRETWYSMQRQSPLILLGLAQGTFLLFITPISPWLQSMGGMIPETILSLLLVLLVSPWIIMFSWGVHPLHSRETEAIIQTELQENQVSVSRILAWPSSLFSVATAGVMGIIPLSRFLMISPRLIDVLTLEELRAVIAHESGHLRYKHLIFFALVFFLLIELLTVGGISIEWIQWLWNWNFPVWFTGSLAVLVIALFLRFGIGFLSRNFERQADCNSLERVGLVPFSQALMKVAWINGINPQEKNWHHYGIQERIDFLEHCVHNPQMRTQHHHYVKRLKWFCVFLLAAFLAGNVFLSSNTVQLAFVNYRMDHYAENWTEQDIPMLGRVADSLYFEDRLHEAETLYRKVLSLNDQDVHALNNLAWLLTQKKAASQSLEESLSLVKRALEHEPESAYIWDTLAEGYFKAGNVSEAHNAALKAMSLAQEGKGVDEKAGLSYYKERVLRFSNSPNDS